MHAQPGEPKSHPNVSMKRFVIILAVLSCLILVGSVTGIAHAVGDSLLFYVRVARLYSKDPPAKIKVPLAGMSKKQIANTWHAPRGAHRLHEGQDIFAARGTPVYSATNGYVYNIGENRLGGQTVSVIGAGGRVYYYAHLDSYAKGLEEGDYVTTKTKLGSVGTTGNAQGTPPHLHFGVYATTGAIDPLPLFESPIKLPKFKVQSSKLSVQRPKSNVQS
ncbi:MAG: M23 family metallopeptidase [Acidobacteriota bacterium]|nr:M23 family metallopeptidase [Acidobacteriota bacterium]